MSSKTIVVECSIGFGYQDEVWVSHCIIVKQVVPSAKQSRKLNSEVFFLLKKCSLWFLTQISKRTSENLLVFQEDLHFWKTWRKEIGRSKMLTVRYHYPFFECSFQCWHWPSNCRFWGRSHPTCQRTGRLHLYKFITNNKEVTDTIPREEWSEGATDLDVALKRTQNVKGTWGAVALASD